MSKNPYIPIPSGADTETMWLLASLERHEVAIDAMAATVLAHVEVCPGCDLCGHSDEVARQRLIELARRFINLEPPKENR